MIDAFAIGYAFEPEQMKQLKYIEKELYGRGEILTPDRRRDLANLLNLVLSRAVLLDCGREGHQWVPTVAEDAASPFKCKVCGQLRRDSQLLA